jgi:putative transposase
MEKQASPRWIDGIRFQTLRYFNTLLAAYVGESITIRYDPNDMAEIRIFHQNRFLCRAVCQELAGETISLKDIIRARQQRQRDLRQTIEHRRSIVDQWFKYPAVGNHAADPAETIEAIKSKNTSKTPLKRYAND